MGRLFRSQNVINSPAVQGALKNYIPEDVGNLGKGGLGEAMNRPTISSSHDVYNAISQEIERTTDPLKKDLLNQALDTIRPSVLQEAGGNMSSPFSKLNLGGKVGKAAKWAVIAPLLGTLGGLGFTAEQSLIGGSPTSVLKKAVIPSK